MARCTSGHDVADGLAFCDVCFNPIVTETGPGGSTLVSPAGLVACPDANCQKLQDPALKFCESCGAELVPPGQQPPKDQDQQTLVAAGTVTHPSTLVTCPNPACQSLQDLALKICQLCGAQLQPAQDGKDDQQDQHQPQVDKAMRARLVVVSEPAAAIKDFEAPCMLSLGRVDPGRGFEADVNFDTILTGDGRAAALGVSRQHAYVVGSADGSWQIEHGGATNSVWVNNQVRLRTNGETEKLANGTQIKLGNLELRFELLP